MVRQHQPIPLRTHPRQHEPHQRRPPQIKRQPPLRLRQLPHPHLNPSSSTGASVGIGVGLGVGLGVSVAEIDDPERYLDPARDHLERPTVRPLPEPRTQVRMTLQQSLSRLPQPPLIHRTHQIQHELRRVHVRVLRVVARVEGQALLQRRQVQDILQPAERGVLDLQGVDLLLGELDQGEVGRGMPADPTRAHGLHDLGQLREPGPRQLRDLPLTQQLTSPRPHRPQHRPITRILRKRIHLHHMRQRHPGIATTAQA